MQPMKENAPFLTKTFLCIAVAFLLFLSCDSPFSPVNDGEDDPDEPAAPPRCVVMSSSTQVMQPLAVGNYWVYHTWFITPNIQSVLREEITRSHDIECLTGKFRAYTTRIFRHYENTPLIPGAEWLVANSDRGLESIGAIAKNDTLLLVSPKYQLTTILSEKWLFELPNYDARLDTFFSVEKFEMQLIDTDGVFTTDYGHFENCHVFRFEENGKDDAIYTWHHYIYFKPGFGMVGRRTRDVLFAEDVDDPNLPIIGEWTLIDHKNEQ